MATYKNNKTAKSGKTNNKTNNAAKGGKAKKAAKKERPVYEYELKVTRVFDGEYGQIFDLEINHVTVYGCRVCETGDGEPFIGWPQKKGKDGRYRSHAYAPLTDEQTGEILAQVAAMLEDEEDEDEDEEDD